MTYHDLVTLLKERRMSLGISQAELGRRLGLTSGGMSQRESEQRQPNTFDELQRWCSEVGVELTALIPEEASLLSSIRALDADQQAAVANLLQSMGRTKKSI